MSKPAFSRRLALLMLLGMALAAAAPRRVRPATDPNAACAGASCGQLVYFGTRGEGPGKGIAAARFDGATGRLTGLGVVADVINPTWLVASPHRAILYSVSEVGNDGRSEAAVLSFAVDKRSGRLASISRVGSGGGGATHLEIASRAMPPSILVANYGTGQVSAIPLSHGGVLSAPTSVLTETGSGPSPRQQSAHPHGTVMDSTGRYVFVADLGADSIFVDRFDPTAGRLSAAGSVTLPPGSGPRHIVARPDGRFLYANAELTGDIMVLRWDAAAARLSLVKSVPTRATGYTGELSSAELVLSPDANFLYVSNRGEDDIAVYAINANSGDLKEVQRLSSGGRAPVGLAFDPTGRWLAVANAESDLVSVFAFDPTSGMLRPTGRGLTVTRPASVAWLMR